MKLKITSTPARRHGSVKPNAAAIPEEEETKGANLDKSFGFSKQFASKYEIGEEMGRGHFGYTCSAIVKIGELKGQKVVVKKELITLGLLEWNKSRVTAEIPKYGKKVPKNTISAVAGFTAVYWLYNCSDMFKITSFKDTSGVLITY
ncbi:hypothetical protein KY290_036562 [Solanum tuberosum]|uniref:Uncharacterized protein n=1 Tax=Solanum tuberosum TaxID=4113 RepID=A0ABQ7TT18_SOLTU|nr:hypothetical protein KY289_036048 [Solanum tuberosum]KAH0639289.1 hypothetical protein KY285_035875 [Solanum tuberosum]KAH0737857.1 hypothetical protein KY290_036562 [Solanum tuberosum]